VAAREFRASVAGHWIDHCGPTPSRRSILWRGGPVFIEGAARFAERRGGPYHRRTNPHTHMPKRFAAAVLVSLAFASESPAQSAIDAGSSVSAHGSLPGERQLSAEESAVNDKVQRLARGGQLGEAEALLRDWMARNTGSVRACGWLAEFLLHDFPGRPTRFDDGMAVADRCITLDDPTNARSRQTIANKYWEKAQRGGSLTDEQRDRYADQGLKYTDLALKIKPNLVDSLTVKGLLLRTKALVSKDDKKRKAYLAEADRLQQDAKELRTSGKGELSGAELPAPVPPPTSPRSLPGASGGVVGGSIAAPPPPPPPPPPPALGPVRVGGAIKEPRKTKHVEFIYPEIAKAARVQGIVIMECTISPEGKVVDVRVLRSIPLLDAAAIDAVKQWEYTPTLLNGVPVPVIMTVTANFRLS